MTRNDLFKEIKADKVYRKVSKQIKDLILSGELNSGDKLPSESELAKALNVGRPSVREALRELGSLGLVKVRQGKGGGVFISELISENASAYLAEMWRFGKVTVEELFEVRMAVEPYIVRLAAEKATEEDLAELRRAIEDEGKYYKQEGIKPYKRSNHFYKLIGKASQNTALAIILDSISNILLEIDEEYELTPEFIMRNFSEHKRILRAIEERDPEQAYELMKNHARETLKIKDWQTANDGESYN